MSQTPTFRCIEKCDLHHADVGDIVKMSHDSLEEFNNIYPDWQSKYVRLSLDEELVSIFGR